MIISELLPGDKLEYEIRFHGERWRRKCGIVVQVTANHITLDLGKYKDSFTMGDLESGNVRIITEEDGDIVSWEGKGIPSENELWNIYLKTCGNIFELSKKFGVSTSTGRNWVVKMGWPTKMEEAKEFIAQKVSEWPENAESFMTGVEQGPDELVKDITTPDVDPDVFQAIAEFNNRLEETRQTVGQSLCEFNDTINKIKDDTDTRNESMFDVIRLQQKYAQDVASLIARIAHLENRQSPPVIDLIERLELIESSISPDGETLPLMDQKISKVQTDISELTHAVMLLHEAFINYRQNSSSPLDRCLDIFERLLLMAENRAV